MGTPSTEWVPIPHSLGQCSTRMRFVPHHSAALIATIIPVVLCLTGGLSEAAAADANNTFLQIVRSYADTMIERGRDTHGPVSTHLFLSALDRKTLSPLTALPAPPGGVREIDRIGEGKTGPLVGANVSHDQNLIRILYALSKITRDPKYAEAADESIRWFFRNAAWPQTGLLPWGEHMNWQVITDKPASRFVPPRHEFGRPWQLWDRSYELAPEGCATFARGLWEHQIANHQTGGFDRHALPHKHGPVDEYDFPRHAGCYIATWAAAYKHNRDELYPKAIQVLLARFEAKRHARTGLISAWADQEMAWPMSELSMAVDCHSAAADVPEPLAEKLRAFAAREDEVFLSLPHTPDKDGFVVTVSRETGRSLDDRDWQPFTRPWAMEYGECTTAQMAMLCLARHDQAPQDGYRRLVIAAADLYLLTGPEPQQETWPIAFGHVISTELAAYRFTKQRKYFDRAAELGRQAVELFWANGPLPRASTRTEHYESITGADSLALSLLELAMTDTPAFEHVPGNTIDR
jgi:hypothetical protein